MVDGLCGFNKMLWTGFRWLGLVAIFLACAVHAEETITTPFGELPTRIVVNCSSISGHEWTNYYYLSESSGTGLSEDITISLYDEKYQAALGCLLKSLPFSAIEKLHIAFDRSQAVTSSWKQYIPFVEKNWIPAAPYPFVPLGEGKGQPLSRF